MRAEFIPNRGSEMGKDKGRKKDKKRKAGTPTELNFKHEVPQVYRIR